MLLYIVQGRRKHLKSEGAQPERPESAKPQSRSLLLECGWPGNEWGETPNMRAEGARERGGGSGGPPPEKFENLDTLRCIFRTFEA